MRRHQALSLLAAAVGAFTAPLAFAGYTINTLASFNGINGNAPAAGLTLIGNTLYGTCVGGGPSGLGEVFSVPTAGGTPTTLGSFNGYDGSLPESGLIVAGNTLYGTTAFGGNTFRGGATTGSGTVFSLPITGGTPTVLTSFDGSFGSTPSGLILSGSSFYGSIGSSFGSVYGTIYSLPLTGGAPTVLASLNGSNGSYPDGNLTIAGGTLYGAASEGGYGFSGKDTGYGTIFSVPLSGGTPAVLGSFNPGNGSYPNGGVVISGGNIYGAASYGGGANNSGYGFAYSLPTAGGPLTQLAVLNGSNGAYPSTGLLLSGNTLFGTASSGGNLALNKGYGDGTVFSLPLAGGSPTVLATFNGSNGSDPEGNLIASGQTLYGTTEAGGPSNGGTIFSLTYDHVILSSTAPPNFGSRVGALAVTGGHGFYNAASASFAATPTGYLAVSGFNPISDDETYALEISDSAPSNLAADLADLASEIDAGFYPGYTVAAYTTDTTGGILASGYNFYINVTNDNLRTATPYFGFDLTQLNGTSDTLSVASVAVVPEPGCLGALTIGSFALLCRRRR